MAQVDYFLKLDGISGESLNPDYKENIDVESWSWGVSNSGNAIGRAAGGGAGKVSAQDIHFTVPFSKASPQVAQACTNGKHIPSATLTGIDSGRSSLDFLTIKLTEVFVTNWETSAGGDKPTDQFTLNFAKMEIDYRPQNPDGALGEASPAVLDFAKFLKY
jgi:type VI secretion system secreted protein Hcp